jgi:hypothetical protein
MTGQPGRFDRRITVHRDYFSPARVTECRDYFDRPATRLPFPTTR